MKKVLFSFCSVIVLFGSCNRDRWHFFNMHNDSNISIRVCGAYILPETMLPEKQLKSIKILPRSNSEINCRLFDDDDYCMRLKDEKVTLWVFDDNVFQTIPWDTIRKYNMFLKRYEFNRQELTSLMQKYEHYYALPYP